MQSPDCENYIVRGKIESPKENTEIRMTWNSKHLGLGGYPEQNGTERALYPIYFRYITQTDMEPHAGSPEFEQMKSLVGTWEGLMPMDKGGEIMKMVVKYRLTVWG